MRTRPHYITLVEAEPGMVIGAPVRVVQNGYLRFSLPAGHILTEDTLHKLSVNQAEYLFVAEPETRNCEDIAVDAAQAAHHVMAIFEGADFSNPTLAALFDQVLSYRSA